MCRFSDFSHGMKREFNDTDEVENSIKTLRFILKEYTRNHKHRYFIHSTYPLSWYFTRFFENLNSLSEPASSEYELMFDIYVINASFN